LFDKNFPRIVGNPMVALRQDWLMASGADPDRRDEALAQLLRAQQRLARLETIFANEAAIERLLREGRYLRLCAAIGRAGWRVEECRARLGRGRCPRS
jgi:hypothetical protein